MKLRTRLTLAFLACGVIPMLAAVVVSYRTADKGMNSIESRSEQEFENQTQNMLTAVRSQKKAQIESYFKDIKQVMTGFAENDMVVSAMRDLKGAYKQFREDNAVTPEELERMKGELTTYYTSDFSEAFKKQNDNKAPDVQSYLGQLDEDSIALQYNYIKKNPNPVGSKHKWDRADDQSTYSELHSKYHPAMRVYVDQFGFYDIFLVDPENGDIFYTCFKETDFTTSLVNGPNAPTGLGDAFRKAMTLKKGEFVFADFQLYWPSYQVPAMFIAAPVFDGEERIGVAAFQLPVDRINQIATSREGLGETGEIVLVGSDYQMRCDSFRDPKNHSVIASFRVPESGKVDTPATHAAFEKSETGFATITDYVKNECLIAFGPIDILGTKWCMNAKMDTSEALAAVKDLKASAHTAGQSVIKWSVGLAIGFAVLVAVVGIVLSMRLAKPIVAAANCVKSIANGDLTTTCTAKASGEVGDLIQSMNDMSSKLRDTVRQIRENSQTVASSSTELSATATQLAAGAEQTTSQSATVAAAAEEMAINMNNMASAAEQMSSGVKNVSAAIEEMTASINEISKNTERAATAAGSAASLANVSNDKVAQLGTAADEIGKVVTVIQDIAEQTNLLALNATIEAARAGEAGKGFAVVASEVKELARQTASATEDIAKRISAIQSTTTESVKAIGEIVQAIASVNDVSGTIAAAIEEQSATTKEIARNMSQTATAAETVSVGVAQSASASKEITRNISGVDQCAKQTATGAGETQQAGQRLSGLSEGLNSLVAQFQV